MKKLIAGNWKMNCSLEDAKALIADVINGVYSDPGIQEKCEVVLFPPYIYLPTIRHALANHTYISFGVQDVSSHENGAHTGDISAVMLKDSACSHVICGHSERRQHHGEANDMVKEKAARVLEQGMKTIICIGETDEERGQGREEEIIHTQLMKSLPDHASSRNTVIAYEPIWAIGTGKNAQTKDIRAMHNFIAAALEEKFMDAAEFQILYGGSVNTQNAAEILALECVHGALVGGASLSAADFLGIARTV